MAKNFKYTDIQVLYELPKQINKTLLERRNVMARKATKMLGDWIYALAYDKGTLKNSVDYRLTKEGDNKLGFELVINGEAGNYDAVQDQGGMQGIMPNVGRIMKWLKNKRGTAGRKTQWKSVKMSRKKRKDRLLGMAIAVARSIAKKGLPAKNFYEPAMNEIDDMVNKEIGKWAQSFQMK